MAHRITVWIVDPGDKKIHVEHVFYGKDKAEAERMKAHHLDACSYFRQAETAGYTDEEAEEIPNSEWPAAEETDGDVIDVEPDVE
jgi:hypothetical protein